MMALYCDGNFHDTSELELSWCISVRNRCYSGMGNTFPPVSAMCKEAEVELEFVTSVPWTAAIGFEIT